MTLLRDIAITQYIGMHLMVVLSTTPTYVISSGSIKWMNNVYNNVYVENTMNNVVP